MTPPHRVDPGGEAIDYRRSEQSGYRVQAKSGICPESSHQLPSGEFYVEPSDGKQRGMALVAIDPPERKARNHSRLPSDDRVICGEVALSPKDPLFGRFDCIAGSKASFCDDGGPLIVTPAPQLGSRQRLRDWATDRRGGGRRLSAASRTGAQKLERLECGEFG